MESLGAQLYAFAVIILAGISCGLIFDGYRVLRGFLRPAVGSTAVMDFFFWLVLAPILVIYLLLANWGELRLYVLIGALLGLALYYVVFSRMIIAMLLWASDIVAKVIGGACQLVIRVVTWPINLIQDIGLGFSAKRQRRRGKFRLLPSLRWKSSLLPVFRRR